MTKRKQIFGAASTLMLLALMVALAGCGGGGGGATTATASAPSYGNVGMSVNFRASVPARIAAAAPQSLDPEVYLENETMYQGCGDLSEWLDEAQQTTTSSTEIPVYLFVTENAQSLNNDWVPGYDSIIPGPIASACTIAYRDTSTQRVTFRSGGDFSIKNVLAGENHLLEAQAYTGSSNGIYVAVVVPYVFEGYYTNDIVASPESTLAAAAILRYASDTDVTLDLVPDTAIDAINTEIDTLFPDGFQYGVPVTPVGATTSITFTDYSDFTSTVISGTMTWDEYVLIEADLATGTVIPAPTVPAPTVLGITPADGATNVDYDATAFRVTFDMPMDTTVTPSGFSLTIQNTSTGGTFTINDANAADYGVFAWENVTTQDDGLSFTLQPTSILGTTGLKYLQPGTTYNITSFTVPTNLLSADGAALDTSSITATTGSFTTAAGTPPPAVAPTVVSFSPTNGDPAVDPANTAFSIVFDMSMDSSIVNPTGFSLTIQNTGTGGTLIINSANASSYGAFTWSTTNTTDDTLTFTLFNSSILAGNGVTGLDNGTTYSITSWTAPTNLVSVGAVAASTAGIPMTGSFTTIP
jgi:hypothetical protein